jgi:hypothetical protein
MGKVKIPEMSFGESQYKRGSKVWKASTLYLFAKAKEYPTFNFPLAAANLSDKAFDADNLAQFIFQCKRVDDCSLEHPIILDEVGQIADGYHRVCKAILEGKETIKAIRLEEMPTHDWEEE